MAKIKAEIVADSINPQGDRVTTYLLAFPRFILAELNTHRVFSKNSASSRAIPFKKMVKMVETDPFIPIAWQKDHKGMQGTEYLTEHDLYFENGQSYKEYGYENGIDYNITNWLNARDAAVKQAMVLHNGGVTKQICNRLLEPFMLHTVLLTGTEFENFFNLRCPIYRAFGNVFKSRKDCIKKYPANMNLTDLDWLKANESQAEIHIQVLAEAMWDAMNESTPKELKAGEWHIPFGDKINDDEILQKIAKKEEVSQLETAYDIYQYYAIKIASARCARLSYMTFDGEIDYEKDLKLHDTLLESQHMSPFEHCVRTMTNIEYYSFVKGRVPTQRDKYGILNYEYYSYSNGKTDREEEFWMGFNGANPNNGDRFGWCNNFKGFIQYRYLIENHYDGFKI